MNGNLNLLSVMIRNTRDFMNKIKLWSGGLAVVAAGAVGWALREGIKRRKQYYRPYKPDTFAELSGIIKTITMPVDGEHGARGVVIMLENKEGEIPVHLGPTWYINHQFDRFKPGEKITVSGSKLHYHGHDVLVASTLQRGKDKFRLRDLEGIPYWDSKISA